jgi:hypothetical protein
MGCRREWSGVAGRHPLPSTSQIPGLLAFPSKVAEAVAAQTSPWQPVSCYSVRVGKTIETSVVKLCGDLPDLRKLFLS